MASDLELDLVGLLVLLYPRRWKRSSVYRPGSNWFRLTGGILAAGNLNELLDIGNLLRHFGGVLRN